MIRNFTLSLFCLSMAFFAAAQLPNGSIAPDFTVTDLDNNVHNLYDYLDEGKSVVIDLSAAWCGPCWTFHQQGTLEQLWEEHGPNGDNSLVVMYIESEPANTTDQIYGIDGGTQATATWGDWTEGVTYPIADDASVADAYDLSFYPTLFVIRPDRRSFMFYDVYYPTYDFIEYYALNDLENDAGIFDFVSGETFCGTSTVARRVNVMNFGTADLTSFTLTGEFNGNTVSTFDWTGQLAPFEGTSVNMPSFEISTDGDLVFTVSNPNGVEDMSSNFNTASAQFSAPASDDMVTFSIRTDFWPEEVHWEFRGPSGAVLFSSNQLGALSCDQVYTQTAMLETDGCYELEIIDDYGDGLLNGSVNPGSHNCGTANGQASIAMGEVALVSSNGDTLFSSISYGEGTTTPLQGNNTTAVREITTLNAMTLYPNPVADVLNVDFELSETTEMEVKVVNSLGQVMHRIAETSYVYGNNSVSLDLNQLPKGVYYLTFESGNGINSKRFTVQ